MRVKVRCTNSECRAVISADESKSGQTAACPKCHANLVIRPMAETAAEDDTASDPAEAKKAAKSKASSGKKQIGRFEIRKRLGAGGFGTVYLAHDPVLNRDVALKVPNPAVLENPKAKERFLREPKAAAKLQHPNIVPVFDTGTDGEHHYIALAFIEGESLQQAIELRKPRFRHSAELVRDLALALEYAHGQGIVHRDVKPANVMVDALGKPMLMDFGLAHLQDSEDKLTRDGAVMGTPAYMAPEQADSARGEVGPASDQYALGVVLYQLLTGDTPFSGPPSVVLFNVLSQEPKPPRSIDKSVPRDLETICLKAMSKEPASRYADCALLAEDLGRWLKDDPIQARPIGPIERTVRWCRRRPALATTLAVAVVLMLIVGVVSSRYFRTSDALDEQTAGRAAAEAREEETAGQLDRLKLQLEAALAELAAAKQALSSAATDAEREAARDRIAQAETQVAEAQVALGVPEDESGNAEAVLEEPVENSVDPPETDEATDETDTLAPPDTPLRGLLPKPVDQPGIGRWQLETAALRSVSNATDWSPDGKLLACGKEAGIIRIYEAVSLRQVGLCVGHTGEVTCVQWSRDGKHLASASRDGTIRLWAADGSPTAIMRGHSSWVHSVAWSPNGDTLVSGGQDTTVRLWNANGEPIDVLKGHSRAVRSVAWSRDGQWIASGSLDRTIRLWSPEGECLRTIEEHDGSVTALDWNPNSTLLASGGDDMTVRLFNTDGSRRAVLKGHTGDVLSVAWSSDGRRIASGDGNRTLRLWLADGTPGPVLRSKFDGRRYFSLAWSPDCRSLAVASSASLSVWQVGSTDSPMSMRMHLGGLFSIAWSPNGQWIASGELTPGSRKVRMWASDGTSSPVLHSSDPGRNDIAWSPDRTQLAFPGSEDTVCVWNVGGSLGPVLQGHTDQALTVAWSPDGNLLASAGKDRTIRIWNGDGGIHRVLKGHTGEVLSLAWDPDDQLLASAGTDGTVRLWSRTDGNVIVLKGHQGSVNSVAWTHDGRWLASGGSDATIRLWNADGTPGPVWNAANPIFCLAWNPRGDRLASGNESGLVEIWTTDGEPEHSLRVTFFRASSVTWSPDGRRLAGAGAAGGAMKVWDASTGDLAWTGMLFQDGNTVAFDPSGRFLQGDRSVIEREFIYLVEQPSGRVDILRPSEFERLSSRPVDEPGK